MEPLCGYLLLAANLKKRKNIHGQSFNFGPKASECYTVNYLVKAMNKELNNKNIIKLSKLKYNFKESNLLMLDCTKSRKLLNWKTLLSFKEMIQFIVKWYVNFYKNPQKIEKITEKQIKEYQYMFEKRVLK